MPIHSPDTPMFKTCRPGQAGTVTLPRVSRIMDLLLLAPDIQEEILALPAVEAGHDPIHERQLRAIAAVQDWWKQRKTWAGLS